MAASDYGYYRSDGIQNSGTALRYGNGNAYIYNNAGQIYPREMSKSYSSGDFGNFTLSTYRTIGGYRTCAYQGAKSSTSSSSSSARICYGHIVPDAIPRVKNLLRVEYCKIEYKAHSCGIHSIDRTLSFNVCTNNNDIPDMPWKFLLSIFSYKIRFITYLNTS